MYACELVHMFRRIIVFPSQTRQKGIYRYTHTELQNVKINGGNHKLEKSGYSRAAFLNIYETAAR